MTADELRIALATALGLPLNELAVQNASLASLVAQAEKGLSEERLSLYAVALFSNHPEADPISWISFEGIWHKRQRQGFWTDIGKLILSSPEDRAKAMLEVLRP